MSKGTHGLLSEQYRTTVAALLASMGQMPGRPEAMAGFDGLFRDRWRHEEVTGSGRAVVGTLCNFVPEELILAVGAIPVRLDMGHGATEEAGGRFLDAEVCSAVRALAGAQSEGLLFHGDLDLLVIPAACDGKKKLSQRLGGPVHLMELPQRKGGVRQQRRWYEEVEELISRLEQVAGRKLKRKPLRQAVDLYNKRTASWRRLMELRWQNPGALGGQDAFLVAQASFIADPTWWVEHTEGLLTELEGSLAGGDEAGSPPPVPLLLTGSPILFPNCDLLQLREELGAVVVADEMCSGTQRLYNPAVLDEGSVRGMVRAVADKALLPCTCPCFVGGDDRINRVLDLCRRSGARGVVSHNLRLCQLFDMEEPTLSAALMERGIPMLSLTTDGGAGAMGPLRTRVEAFLEMLV